MMNYKSLHYNIHHLIICSIQFLRHMRDFYNLIYKLEENEDDGTVLVTVVGLGYTNINKPSK